ncbi:tryptophan--tRNA ligase [Candidatus Acetothermia bacterium]|nr:tryptophan--tRNA ligase [Candidatus Acetothermia bacterium]MBI3643176.1 tryptophan--tRNA ligase [Candidatus Acetothermia bacterium]
MAEQKRERILSGIQPTGEMQIGNYFGAVQNWVRLQDSYECFFGIVDLHAITMPYQPEQLRKNTERLAVDLIACGIDPGKSLLFIQSLIPEHTDLCWIVSCFCSFGNLTRMTQFKEKSEQLKSQSKDHFFSAGLFTYPVLQAADILIYKASVVPVGQDQKQHLELTADIARRFNNEFGEVFVEPKILFTETPKVMSLADPSKKMGKSLGPKHYIGLFEEEESIRAKVRTAVTDSGVLPEGVEMSPGLENLFEILGACGKVDLVSEMKRDYKAGKLKYSLLKESVADALVELTGNLRASRAEIKPKAVQKSVEEMSMKARAVARETLREVRELAGLPARSVGD